MTDNKVNPGKLGVPDGQVIYEFKEGKREPVVFLHPSIGDMRIWDREFSPGFCGRTIIRVDLRGLVGSGIGGCNAQIPHENSGGRRSSDQLIFTSGV